ncbi:MAG: phosphoribosylamine--glycine ligase [Anaerorhabdus sp.]
MNILIVGSGGREHALASSFKRSKKVKKVFVAPGNSGMKDVATIINIDYLNQDELIKFAKENEIDLTVIGPEIALSRGIADAFMKAGLKVFGPTKAAAKIETSKTFAKELMSKYNIPTAKSCTFDSKDKAKSYIEKHTMPIVLKQDGLCAGKGVYICYSTEEVTKVLDSIDVSVDNRLLVEEFLSGFEFSLMAFVSHDIVIPMEVAQDHKCAYDNDLGPNTGGMGAYSPVKKITKEIIKEATEKVMIPAAKALIDNGSPFVGFLYGGLMLCDDGIKTIEFNARFGDPEAQVILPRLESDILDVILTLMRNETPTLKWSNDTTIGVVLAGSKYPKSSSHDFIIEGLADVKSDIYHMGTTFKNNTYQTNGGRVLCVVSRGKNLREAYDLVYKDIKKIKCDDLVYRSDIGKKDWEE